MPRLIVVNGPPGIGKSTLARRFVEDHPLALCLEQDVVRGLLGGWLTREIESGQLTRELCLAMAAVHLRAGRDVVVPQFVALPDYLDQLAEVARAAGAAHVEVVLMAGADEAERRFHARRDDPRWAEHQQVAAAFIDAAGGYPHQYARLVRGLQGREVVTIRSVAGDLDGTYRQLLDQL